VLLLDAVEANRIERREIGAFVARKIESLNDAALTQRLNNLWGRVRETSEAKVVRIAAVKASLSAEKLAHADASRGRDVFARTCEQCHTLFGEGGHVGPDLTGSNRADLDYLLSNVIDPNAVVGKDYLATMVFTKDERLVTGIKKAENDSSVTLQTENELVVVAKDDIDSMRLSELSTMPEGLLDSVQPDEVPDLVKYLGSPAQVPMLATPSNQGRFFDGKTLAGWRGEDGLWSVEGGEIVGRTTGLDHNSFLVSDLDLGNFKLALDIRLAENKGNSGVQLRSKPLDDGEVQGYQADVGPGWWGKLYEERGRGLLWDKSGEQNVKPGDWNHYEIEARGHHVRTSLNGVACVDLEDAEGALRGVVAIQLHSGEATEVRVRNLHLELLP
jgi:putative heme-binding domain-containing protein